MYNHFKVDVVQSCKGKTCSGCEDCFEAGEFQVTRCRLWHLDCYQPHFPTKIRIYRDVELSAEAEKHVEKLRSWVRQWNAADLLDREDLPLRYFDNYVKRGGTDPPRLMLEVFKFLGAGEVELRASQVCLHWHSVARNPELWLDFFERQFYPGPEIRRSQDIRKDYITHAFQACWHCKHLVEAAGVQYVCPYYRMPLCVSCSALPGCKLMTERELRRTTGLSSGQIKALGVPFFQFGVKKCTYLSLACEKQRQTRHKRRVWALEQLERDELLSAAALRKLLVSPSSDLPSPVLHFLETLNSDPLDKQVRASYTRLKQALRPRHKQTIS